MLSRLHGTIYQKGSSAIVIITQMFPVGPASVGHKICIPSIYVSTWCTMLENHLWHSGRKFIVDASCLYIGILILETETMAWATHRMVMIKIVKGQDQHLVNSQAKNRCIHCQYLISQ